VVSRDFSSDVTGIQYVLARLVHIVSFILNKFYSD